MSLFIENVICCQMLEKLTGKVLRIRGKEARRKLILKNFGEMKIVELNYLKVMDI